MKIAIVGAGSAGLVAAKYSMQHDHECDIFEQTGAMGGIWIYTEDVEKDEDGVLVHTSMYKDLTYVTYAHAVVLTLPCRTNFPKELMTYADFLYPDNLDKSYISQEEVLDYLHAYADKYNIKPLIKFFKRVVDISPDMDGGWIIKLEDVKTKAKLELRYDAVLICNGRYSDPVYPKIDGQHLFRGPQTHSRHFRTPEPFRNQTVLIVGGSYSGQELCLKVASVAKRVILSHREPRIYIEFPENLTEKPVVDHLMENGASFVDGTVDTFDSIIYCTGFKYVCPFVNDKCGLSTDSNWIRPLYKQIINIEHPTMHFIGLPYVACGIPLFDLQVRFSLAALENKFRLPPKETMITELESYMNERRKRGIPDFEAHKLGGAEVQKEYLQQLSDVSGIEPVRPVIHKLFCYIKNCVTRPGCRFKIEDDANFSVSTTSSI